MPASYEEGRFVNVVGTIDAATGAGEILYVNPTKSRVTPDAAIPRLDRAELVFKDGNDRVMERVHPVLRASSCEGTAEPSSYLIQEDVPIIEGMRSVVLVVDGQERGRFEAGPPPTDDVSGGLALGPPPPSGPRRQELSVDAVAAEPGVSYIVEAKQGDDRAWRTLAIGRSSPTVQLDWNQFPGASYVDVRVTRSTGFEEEVVAQKRMKAED